jgi:large subunit ribosomal protein L15
MNLHSLPKLTENKRKRLGRGHGSGHVKTSGRGTKGTTARYTVPLTFEGGIVPLTKRIPFLRGKSVFKPLSEKSFVLNVSDLNVFKKDDVVDAKSLVEKKLIKAKESLGKIKILGAGELKVALTVKLRTSKEAKNKIEKIGGKVVQE